MVNVEKSLSVPSSLAIEKSKSNGSYREHDVVKQINMDFNGKCYLCEDKDLTAINVEHFKPHRGDKNLKFDWLNLFYCCAHCNNVKGDKVEFDHILNCTNPNVDVLRKIELKIDPIPRSRVVVIPLDDDIETKNTATLLERIYNGEATSIKLHEGLSLRKRLMRELIEFNKELFKYDDDRYTSEEKIIIKREIQLMLNVKSIFAAFKIWSIWNNPELKEEFLDILPYVVYKP